MNDFRVCSWLAAIPTSLAITGYLGWADSSTLRDMSMNKRRSRKAIAVMAAALSASVPAYADPNCAGPERWPAGMAYAWLKNVGLLSPTKVNNALTTSDLIVSQKIGPNLYRQVFKVVFHLKDGHSLAAIAVSNASSEECSMSDVTVYRIAESNEDGKKQP